MHRLLHSRQTGQSLVMVALMALVLFLMVGMAVDGGMLYMQRRLMQNTADAACLAAANQVALQQPDSAAVLRAQQVIAENLGPVGPGTGVNAPGSLAYTNVADVYANDGTSGVNLTKGIEVSGNDVRVAIDSPSSTFFMRLGGVTEYTVGARTHCGARDAGGVLPFAVLRYQAFEQPTGEKWVAKPQPNVELTLPQYFDTKGKQKMYVRDVLEAFGKNTGEITTWPGNPGDPVAGTGLYGNPPSGKVATLSKPGPVVPLAGSDANPGITGNGNWSGPIILDFRDVSFAQPVTYNGLATDTGLNQYKDFLTRYILGGYPGPWVTPGQQLGYYSGVSAGQVYKPFDVRYNVGDIVTMLLYNGNIYDIDQSFTIGYPTASSTDWNVTRDRKNYSGTCTNPSFDKQTFDGETTNEKQRAAPALFKVKVTPVVGSNIRMRAFGSTAPNTFGQLAGRWNGGSWKNLNILSGSTFAVGKTGQTISFEVQPTTTFDCEVVDTTVTPPITETITIPTRVNGTQSIYIEAQDQGTTRRNAAYVLLDMDASSDDFFVYSSPLIYKPLEPGKSDTATVFFELSTGTKLYANNAGITTGTIQWFNASDHTPLSTGSSYNGVTVAVSSPKNKDTTIDIQVSNSAVTGREYYIYVPFTYKGKTQGYWYFIGVRPSINSSQSTKEFVYALGYANFRITDIKSNNVYGEAVSGLLRPDEIRTGVVPRLLPWD